MKRILLSAATLITFTTQGTTSPTFYGLLNKEVRFISQEDEAQKQGFTGVTDVDGFESRIGAKGNITLKSEMNLDYVLELGINSFRDGQTSSSNQERIRIRRSAGKINTKAGSFTFGQEWLPNTLRMLNLDAFSGTGAQLLGLDSENIGGSLRGNYGQKARY